MASSLIKLMTCLQPCGHLTDLKFLNGLRLFWSLFFLLGPCLLFLIVLLRTRSQKDKQHSRIMASNWVFMSVTPKWWRCNTLQNSLWMFACGVQQDGCDMSNVKLWRATPWTRVCPICRVAAVPRGATLRAGAFLLLQRSAAGRGEGSPLCRCQELSAVAVAGQYREAGTQGWSHPKLVESVSQQIL